MPKRKSQTGRPKRAAARRTSIKRRVDRSCVHGWLTGSVLPHFVSDIQHGLRFQANKGGRGSPAGSHTVIDLFCGAGGFTKGFVASGFESVWANDFDEACVETFNANFGPHAVPGDIEALLRHPDDFPIPKADVVIGGPPCQGFSLLNKNRNGDSRRDLWKAYWTVVDRARPSVFVMENVPELLVSDEYAALVARSKASGFDVTSAVLSAADYGVPQKRKRAIVIGSRVGVVSLPERTHADPREARELGLLPWTTVRDAIADLPKPRGTEPAPSLGPPLNLHFGRTPTRVSVERYRAVPEGGNRFDLQRRRPDITPACWIRKTSGGTDLFGRLWWDRPSVTIRTEFFKPEKGRYLHPTQHRPITHREAARLQSFPDDFHFIGSKIEIARQIGNAVPVLLAAAIAGTVARALERPSARRAG